MFTFYLDAMVAQPRHEILQSDVFMEERTHDVSFSFDTRQCVLGSQILGKPSEHKTRFSHHFLLHFSLLFWSVEQARHYSAVTKIPYHALPLKTPQI